MPFFKNYRVVLAAINLFVVVFAYLSFDGYEFYDDLHYIKAAHAVNQGTFDLDANHFNARWGLIFPLAAMVKIFGLNDAAIIALLLLFTLATINLIFWLFNRSNPQVALIAALFLALDFYTLWFSRMVYPDVMLTTYVVGALAVLFVLWVCDQNDYCIPSAFSPIGFVGRYKEQEKLCFLEMVNVIWRHR